MKASFIGKLRTVSLLSSIPRCWQSMGHLSYSWKKQTLPFLDSSEVMIIKQQMFEKVALMAVFNACNCHWQLKYTLFVNLEKSFLPIESLINSCS